MHTKGQLLMLLQTQKVNDIFITTLQKVKVHTKIKLTLYKTFIWSILTCSQVCTMTDSNKRLLQIFE